MIKDNKKFYRRLSIGYNGDPDFFSAVVLPFKKYLSSVYSSPGTSLGISSARFTPNITPARLLRFRRQLKSAGIPFNLVYNFDGISDTGILKALAVTAERLKPDEITVNGTFVLDAFLRIGKYKLNISIINDINSINQLCQLLERDTGGLIASYNIGRRKTYDPRYIAAVRKKFPRLKLKLMVNEGCIFECPDQNFHSCTMTMTHGKRIDPGIFYCHKLPARNHWRFLTGQYIPPKFLHKYLGLADEFKIATRGAHGEPAGNDFIRGILEEYVDEADIPVERAMRSSFGGSFFIRKYPQGPGASLGYSMPYPDDFFKMRTACAHDCWRCDYCKKILK